MFGDSTATSNVGIAKNCTYARYLGSCPGSGTIVVDSFVFYARDGANGIDSGSIALYLDSSGTKPSSRVSLDTAIIDNNSISFQWWTKIPTSTINLTAGVAYWVGLSAHAGDTGTVSNWSIGTTANTTAGVQKCGSVNPNPWGAIAGAGTPAAWSFKIYGHDGSAGGNPGGTTTVYIGGSNLGGATIQ